MSHEAVSPHPADRLIRALIRTGRTVIPDEIARIVDRLATAPFDRRLVRVRPDERGATYQGQTLGVRADSLAYHLTKRVAIERQWAVGTTAEQYTDDLRRAIRAPSARLVVYERQGGHLAATITPTSASVPAARRGPRALPWLLVIYSADRGIIVTGYQVSALETISMPQEVRWLV